MKMGIENWEYSLILFSKNLTVDGVVITDALRQSLSLNFYKNIYKMVAG